MIGSLQHIKSVTIGDMTGTVTVFNSQGSTATAAASLIVLPSDWDSIHKFGMTITGNTAGASSIGGATGVYLAGGSNVTLSMTTAASAATVSINAAQQVNQFVQFPLQNAVQNTLTNNSAYFQPLAPQANVNVDVVQFAISASNATSSNSRNHSYTVSVALYQQGLGGNSTQLTLQSSVSVSFAVHRSSNSNTWTLAVNGGTTSTTAVSWINGANILQFPLATTLQAGNVYWLGMAHSSATAVATNLAISYLWQSNTNITGFGFVGSGGVAGIAANNIFNFDALQFNGAITSWSNSLALSQLQRATSGTRLYVEFISI